MRPLALAAVLAGEGAETVRGLWRPGLEDFLKRREAFLLYPRP